MDDSFDVTSDAARGDPSGGRGPVGPGDPPAAVVVDFSSRRRPEPPAGAGGAFTVDCAECAHRDTEVCDDCVVSFIVGRAPEDALVVDAAEARAVRLLERAGLVPGVRHQARASGL